jgi:hypothetical protein
MRCRSSARKCNGPLYETREGKLIKFNCQIGHSFSLESLTAAHTDALERALWIAVRTLDERIAIHEGLAQQQRELENTPLADRLAETASSATHDVKLLRQSSSGSRGAGRCTRLRWNYVEKEFFTAKVWVACEGRTESRQRC